VKITPGYLGTLLASSGLPHMAKSNLKKKQTTMSPIFGKLHI